MKMRGLGIGLALILGLVCSAAFPARASEGENGWAFRLVAQRQGLINEGPGFPDPCWIDSDVA
jgi:hypothetical protein